MLRPHSHGIALQEDVNLESPVPPLMTTPGLKPLRKNKQTKQVTIHGLSTAVAAEILRSQDCVSSTENSPIPPTMTTPGVKQVRKFPGKGLSEIF